MVERIPSGIEGLDAFIGGGLLRGSITTVSGPTGSGKTTLSMQFLIGGIKK
jgi:circadian clock protein KaiC